MAKPDFEALNSDLRDCLSRCANGDRAAFKTIYDLTSPKFSAILHNQLRDADAVRDVLQQAYLSIWKNAGRFDPDKGNAFTWMLVIMRNRGLDRLRSVARTPTTEVIEDTIVDDSAAPEQLARNSSAGRLISKHLANLPEHVATCISLNVVQGLSCTEIGTALNVSPNTVKGWVRRGLLKLRAEMPISSVSAVL